VRISIKAKPGSKQGDKVVETAAGVFDVHIKQKPVDGKANEALIKVLAKHFGVRQNDVEIVSGFTSRMKIVEIKKPA
jgi:uncharacterized protein (TIGR00251 family)